MKSAEDIMGLLADHIGAIYQRPMNFERDLPRLETLLFGYHHVWANIMDKDLGFALLSVQAENGYDPSMTYRFDDFCALNDRLKSEEDRLSHFVALWRQVSERLEVPIRDHYEVRLTLKPAKEYETIRKKPRASG